MTDAGVSRFAGRDGLEPAYREIGEGRPLLLLHGFAGSGTQWLDHGPGRALAARDRWRLILPDLRGHGESPARRTPRTTRRTSWWTTPSR